jgi:hypothetical protein
VVLPRNFKRDIVVVVNVDVVVDVHVNVNDDVNVNVYDHATATTMERMPIGVSLRFKLVFGRLKAEL